MKRSILTDAPPTAIKGVPINWDYRCMIQFERIVFDEEIPSATRVERILSMFYLEGLGTMSMGEAWDRLTEFYRGETDSKSGGTGRRSSSRMRAYDYDVDAERIVAAFQQAYGIDLTCGEAMHWWRFKALFDNLPADCRLCKIMEYRTADTSGMPDKARAFYERMRSQYALEARSAEPMTVEKHDNDFIKRLRRER